MKINISAGNIFDVLCGLNSEPPKCWFVAENRSKKKKALTLKNGERPCGYIANKTENGIQLLPVVGNKKSQALVPEESVFLSNEEIKSIYCAREDLHCRIKIKLTNGTALKLKAKQRQSSVENRENLKSFRKCYLKNSRRVEAISFITAVILGLLLGFLIVKGFNFAYSYSHIDGNVLLMAATGKEYVNLYKPLYNYDKADISFSDETQLYENEFYKINLPAELNRLEKSEGTASAIFTLPDKEIAVIIDNEGIDDEDNVLINVLDLKFGLLCKKYYGIRPNSYYNLLKLEYSINFNDLDVNDKQQVILFSSMFLYKTLISDCEIYNIENENYCGMLMTQKVGIEENGKKDYFDYTFFKADNLDKAYTVTVICKDETLHNEAYAIINSIEFK